MGPRQYLKFARSHPVLNELVKDEKGKYEPIYRLGERVKKKVSELLLERDNRINELFEYIPFVDKKSDTVTKDQSENLRNLIKEEIGNWPFPDESTILRSFWYCYSKFKHGDTYRHKSMVKLEILDLLSQFVGLKDFEELIQLEFSRPKRMCIVFLRRGSDNISQTDENIQTLIRDLIEMKKLNVRFETPVIEEDKKPGAITISDAKIIAKGAKADLVAWVAGEARGFVTICCHAINPVWAQHHGAWEGRFPIEDTFSTESEAYRKLLHTLYWCLFNLHFFKKEYRLCSYFLEKAKKLKLDPIEIPFRVGVLHDLMENSEEAKIGYLHLLKQIGVEDAVVQLNQQFLSSLNGQTTDDGNFIKIEGELIRLDDISIERDVAHPGKDLMYFERVRLKLFTLIEKKLNKLAKERVLEKIVKNAKIEWHDDDYKVFFAKACFEWGKVLQEKLVEGEDIALESIQECFETAVTVCKEKWIHRHCFIFLKNSGRLEKVQKIIKKHHEDRRYICEIYGI